MLLFLFWNRSWANATFWEILSIKILTDRDFTNESYWQAEHTWKQKSKQKQFFYLMLLVWHSLSLSLSLSLSFTHILWYKKSDGWFCSSGHTSQNGKKCWVKGTCSYWLFLFLLIFFVSKCHSPRIQSMVPINDAYFLSFFLFIHYNLFDIHF